MNLGTITTPPIVSRNDARIASATHYYTGRACSRGHFAKRYTSTGNCCACKTNVRPERDGRRVPRVVRMRYEPSTTFDDRRRAAEYLERCVSSLNTSMGYVVLTIEKL